VFERPDDAVVTATVAPRMLRERRFGGETVRVRMGIHAGYPTSVPGNYIGMAVHVAARVAACGHGGQVVVSGDTREALTGRMPEGVRLRSLGLHRRRGIPHGVALYQLAAKGLPTAFAPVRTVRASG
jgi:class 3 adenylate cyclase